MIQRIQSVYLLLTTLLSVLFLPRNIMVLNNEDGSLLRITISGIYSTIGGVETNIGSSLILVVPVFLTGLISFLAIFMFRRRLVQLWLVRIAFILILIGILVCAYYVIVLANRYEVHAEIGFKLFLPLLIFCFSLLAYRGIMHDEKLVQSYDRLR